MVKIILYKIEEVHICNKAYHSYCTFDNDLRKNCIPEWYMNKILCVKQQKQIFFSSQERLIQDGI